MLVVFNLKSEVYCLCYFLPDVSFLLDEVQQGLFLVFAPLTVIVVWIELPPTEIVTALNAPVLKALGYLAPRTFQVIAKFLLRLLTQ
jgi:hypothetical protein